jgi:hypothetical protein
VCPLIVIRSFCPPLAAFARCEVLHPSSAPETCVSLPCPIRSGYAQWRQLRERDIGRLTSKDEVPTDKQAIPAPIARGDPAIQGEQKNCVSISRRKRTASRTPFTESQHWPDRLPKTEGHANEACLSGIISILGTLQPFEIASTKSRTGYACAASVAGRVN